ncbi:MAG: hypothetical protein EAX96_10765 [Candidatus Lokiarchaeota archaeon]|nr:hypothetical protein [Candidatus Lokiarchaeota archaeon]
MAEFNLNMTIWTDIGKIEVTLFPERAPTAISILKKSASREVPVHFYGKEIFFGLDEKTYYNANKLDEELKKEGQKEIFEIGEVAFWRGRRDIPLTDPLNPGSCICIFFGNTPEADEPRALEPITLIGKVITNLELCEKLNNENIIKIEKIN